jgi:hypothetical protein
MQSQTGLKASVIFVIQREDAESFSPNDAMDPKFGVALREAAQIRCGRPGVHLPYFKGVDCPEPAGACCSLAGVAGPIRPASLVRYDLSDFADRYRLSRRTYIGKRSRFTSFVWIM